MEIEVLKQMDLFWGMNESELQLFLDIATTQNYAAGDTIFREGEECDQLYVVMTGAVEIYTEIDDEVTQTLGEVHSGIEFGEMALIDDAPRSASARAIEDTTLMSVSRDNFLDLVQNNATFSAKALINLSRTLSKRLRHTNDVLRNSMEWNVKIGGASALNLSNLIKGGKPIRAHLLGNEEINGFLLKVEKSDLGHEITIQDENGQIFIVPYHALLYIHVEQTTTTVPLSC